MGSLIGKINEGLFNKVYSTILTIILVILSFFAIVITIAYYKRQALCRVLRVASYAQPELLPAVRALC